MTGSIIKIFVSHLIRIFNENVVIPASSTQLRHVLLNKLRKMLEEAHERERKKSVREKKVKFNYFYHKSYVTIFFLFIP